MSNTNIFGVFDNEDTLISAVRQVQEKGIQIKDVVSPYPIEKLFPLLKLSTRIPIAAYFYGVAGLLGTFGFLYWTSVINYPLVFGGKPQNTLSFVIVIFVAVIFVTILSTIITFFLREKKGPGAVPLYEYEGMTDDKYFIIVENAPGTDAESVKSTLTAGGAIEVTEK
jgi:hypothetical protein